MGLATRYIGDLQIAIEYYDTPGARWKYRGTVSAGEHRWKFSDLGSPPRTEPADSAIVYDHMAASAASFATYYTTHNRGDDTPSWAPSASAADAFDEAAWDHGENSGYYVRRGKAHTARRYGPF